MDNEIYHRRAGQCRDEVGFVFWRFVRVTHEVNGYAVFDSVASENEGLVLFSHNRETAIEFAVDTAREGERLSAEKGFYLDQYTGEVHEAV